MSDYTSVILQLGKTVKQQQTDIELMIKELFQQQMEIEQLKKHSHPAKDMCDMKGYEELVARINKLENKNGNN